MRIEDLQVNESFTELIAMVTSKSAPKEIEFFNIQRTVCNCTIEDGTGEAILVIYDDDIQKMNKDNIIVITNGSCKIYKGELQVTVEKGGIRTIFDEFLGGNTGYQIKSFLMIIEEALLSENLETRKKACEILGKKKKATSKGVNTLETLLTDHSCCESARTAMLEIAKEDNSFFFNYLLCQDPTIRRLARQTIITVETMNDVLGIIFESNNQEIIEETLTELHRFSERIIYPILVSALEHQNELVRVAAKNELNKIEEQRKQKEEEEEKRKKLTDTFTAI